MEVVSVNVGTPRRVAWKGTAVLTAIFKEPVDGAVKVSQLNLAGDRQADRTVHGGPDKAIYGYPSEHYDYWTKELPHTAFSWGQFGENLTTKGLNEDDLFIGDQLKVGTAILKVTQPRLPCYKLTIKFNRDDMIKRFLIARRSGFYFAVVKEGEVTTHSPIEILSRDPSRVSVNDISRLFFSKEPDLELLHRATQLSALPLSWRDDLLFKANARH